MSVSLNTWYNVSIVCENNNFNFYVNGSKLSSGTLYIPDEWAPLRVGAIQGETIHSYFTGYIKDIVFKKN